jgi:hypothetical protein
MPEGFVYTSNQNEEWLSVEDLKKIIYAAHLTEEDPTSKFLSTIHQLNEKVIFNMLNSEECIPETTTQIGA